ncbi:Lipase_(Class 3) and transmembrane domain-containing protein [Hexamita inflata]|uniref:sn-1-specific diacylglycerol lipase n=2 Tax=Hexamita inflata TaxID=28002 RepID=A0AA86U5A2_9EUKA|nr:Lipase (Class 3) and transmembrane domain-containing protein [Hexamita inflata]
MDKKVIFKAFWDELIISIKLTGLGGAKEFIWYNIKFGFRRLDAIQNNSYSEAMRFKDPFMLNLFAKYAVISMNLLPGRVRSFYKSERCMLPHLCKTYAKDKAYVDDSKVSITGRIFEKQIYEQAGDKVIFNYTFKNGWNVPSFYVTKNNKLYTIVVRGTVNSFDIFADLDFTQELHGEYYFHRSFFNLGNNLFKVLQENNLLQKQFTYVVAGHSLGGSVSVVLSHLIYQNVTKNIYCYTYGMSCVGDINFSLHARKFCTCVVNGYDMVPTISYHAARVQCVRLLILDFQRTGRQKQVYIDEQQSGSLKQCIKECFHRHKNDSCTPTRILSEELTYEKDLFIAGNIIHFVKGAFYNVSVHDISEGIFTIPTVIDHTGYYLVAEQAQCVEEEV